jgi:hypothetical protein
MTFQSTGCDEAIWARSWTSMALFRSGLNSWRPPGGLRHWSRFIPPIFAQLLMMIWWRFDLQVQQIEAMANIGLEPTCLTLGAIMSPRLKPHVRRAARMSAIH